jgi:hypothetical protein
LVVAVVARLRTVRSDQKKWQRSAVKIPAGRCGQVPPNKVLKQTRGIGPSQRFRKHGVSGVRDIGRTRLALPLGRWPVLSVVTTTSSPTITVLNPTVQRRLSLRLGKQYGMMFYHTY